MFKAAALAFGGTARVQAITTSNAARARPHLEGLLDMNTSSSPPPFLLDRAPRRSATNRLRQRVECRVTESPKNSSFPVPQRGTRTSNGEDCS